MRIAFFVIAMLLIALGAAPVHAEKRVALVVGNGAYSHADRLANPVNDARGMRAALTRLGFEVVFGEDLDQKALRRAIGQFAGIVKDADVAVVYFAGHGATFGETPYVVPVDAEFSKLDEVPYELVAVETLIGELRRVKGVRIAILDACRDNTAERELKRLAASRGGEVSRGLGPMKNPDGLILAYATQYLSTAADSGGNGNSPFTAALLNNIATPGLDVKDLFFKVGRDVVTATQGRQRPEISISIYDQYALVPAAPKLAATPAASPGAGAAAPPLTTQQTAAVAPPVVPFLPPPDLCGGTVTVSFASRCAAPLTAAQERGLKPKDAFRECDKCPEMVVVPAGSFTMGSPENEKDRGNNEGPQQAVTIGNPFAVGKFHVTVDQFAAFMAEMRYDAGSKCWTFEGGKYEVRSDRSWRNPGFVQEGAHPAVCLNWDDAKAYVEWLVEKTHKPYRLLTEAEWEYSARGRTAPCAYPRFWFGNDEKDLCRYGNGADQKARDTIGGAKGWTIAPCDDGYAYTSPVGRFAANGFGLYDMFGNAWQWTLDCHRDNYKGAPTDGSAWTSGDCSRRVVRGGSWDDVPQDLRSANRSWDSTDYRNGDLGFRVGRTLFTP